MNLTFNINQRTHMPSSTRTTLTLGLAAAAMATSLPAGANPRPLPYSYPYETLPAEEAELEQYVDLTPVRIVDPEDATGNGRLWDQQYRLQTEFEYGITDRLELGLYLVLANEAGGPLAFDGIKQRLRLRLADEGTLPVDIGLYGEIAEFHDELEFEEKLILSKRFDKLRIMANLWFEESLEHYEGELEATFHPTLGITQEISPVLHLGVEYWGQTKFENEAAAGTVQHFNDGFHHYVGPAVSLQFGKLWWSTGAYLRLDEMKRTTEVGDQFGHAWVRTVIALSL
jgi:hypothetical protein